MINTLCDTALLCAFADGKKSVDESGVRTAADELDWKEHESTTGRFRKIPQLVAQPPTKKNITRIVVRTDSKIVDEYNFEAGRVIAGRSPDNEIYIKSKFVSRHHAQLTSNDGGCTIEDLNSTNGIFVGEEQVKKYHMQDGDIVRMGIHELVYTDLRDADNAHSFEPLEENDGDESVTEISK